MQIYSDDMVGYEEHDSLHDEEDECDDDLTISSDNEKKNIDESSTWSFVAPTLENEDQEELVRDELTILPVESSDSMPSCYGVATTNEHKEDPIRLVDDENADSVVGNIVDQIDASPPMISPVVTTLQPDIDRGQTNIADKTINKTSPDTTNAELNQHKSTFDNIQDAVSKLKIFDNIQDAVSKLKVFDNIQDVVSKLKVQHWTMLGLWFMTFIFAVYFARLSSKQSQELNQLRQEIDTMKQTITELESAKSAQDTQFSGWFSQGSDIVKEWASAVSDASASEYYNTMYASSNESSYLDVLPDALKDLSSSMTSIFGEVLDDVGEVIGEVGTTTKEAFTTVGDNLASMGENIYAASEGVSVSSVTEQLNTVAGTMFDILNAQKYALIFGALYFRVYEGYFENDSF
eukprot:972785_1